MALSSEGVGKNKNFKVGAILFDKKGRILAARSNSYKTHPHILHYSNYPYLHAESSVILAQGLDNCEDLSLLVVRVVKSNRNCRLSMALPCKACTDFIHDVGIRNVYYSNWKGDIDVI